MLALKEFANFVTLNMANLATTFSRLLAEQSPEYAAISPDSRTAAGRKLLNAVVEACQEQSSNPLGSLFKENTQQSIRRWPANITSTNPLTEVECLGQTLTPVVTNLEAGKFLWQMLSEIRANMQGARALPPKPVVAGVENTTSLNVKSSNLIEEEGLFFGLIDNLPDIIFIKDVDGRFLLANDALRRQLGAATVEDVIGKTDYDFNPLELADQYRADDRKLMESGEALIGHEEPIYDSETGVTGWVSATKIPFEDEQGNIAGIMGMIRDITELKTAQLTLSTRIRELNCLNELGRHIEEAPDPAELLEWTTTRLPEAMQHPDLCQVAITFDDAVYGSAEAIEIPSQMTHGLYIEGQVQGRVYVAYTKKQDFLNEESALLGAVATRISVFLENQKLFNNMQTALAEARTLANEQTVLTELGQALTGRLNIEQILEEAYRQASRLVDTTNFYIGLYDKEKHQIAFSFDVTESEIDKALTVISADEGLAGHIVRNGTPLLFEDNVAVHEESLGIDIVGQEPESWLGVPLTSGDEVLGVMAVQSYTTPKLYNKHSQELLSAIGSQIAIALQNTYLFEETETRLTETRTLVQEQTVLNEFGQALTALLSVDEVVEKVYQESGRLIDTTNFFIGLYDEEKHEIEFRLMATESEIDREFKSQSADQGLSGYIVRNKTHILLEDNVRERQEALGIQMVGEEPQSWLGVPMIVGGKVLGAMAVQSYTTPGLYQDHDRELLQAVANQAAIAIQNARQFQDTETAFNETQTLYQAGAALSVAQTYNELLEVVRNYSIASRAQSVSIGYFEHAVTMSAPMPPSFDILASWRPGIEEAFRVHYTLEEFPSFVQLARSELTYIQDINQETFLDENLRIIFEAAEAKTVIYAPIAVAGQWIGFLSLIYQQTESFSEAELQRVTAITTQLSSALQNLYSYQETEAALTRVQQAQREAQILQQLAQTLTGSQQTKEVTNAFFNAARQLLGIDFSVFSLVDSHQQRVLAVDGYNITDNHLQRANHPLSSNDIMADIIRTGQTEIIRGADDSRLDQENVEAEGQAEWGLRIFTPITIRQENIGLVEVGFKENLDAEVEDMQVQLLKTLTDQVAISLDNAQRYQASQQAARRELAIREITEKMRAANSIDELIETAATQLGEKILAGHTVVELGIEDPAPSNGK